MKLRDGSTRRGPNTRRRSAKTWETQAGFQRKARAFPCARGGVLPHCCIERGIRHFDSRARIAKASRTAPARAKTDLSDSGDQGSSAVAKLGSAASQITRTRTAASGAIAQMPRKDELIRSSCAPANDQQAPACRSQYRSVFHGRISHPWQRESTDALRRSARVPSRSYSP